MSETEETKTIEDDATVDIPRDYTDHERTKFMNKMQEVRTTMRKAFVTRDTDLCYDSYELIDSLRESMVELVDARCDMLRLLVDNLGDWIVSNEDDDDETMAALQLAPGGSD